MQVPFYDSLNLEEVHRLILLMPRIGQQLTGNCTSQVFLFFWALATLRQENPSDFVKGHVVDVSGHVVRHVNQQAADEAHPGRNVVGAHRKVQLHWFREGVNLELLSLILSR